VSIAVVCGQCDRRINAADKFAGKRVKCPGCGTVVAVPAVENAPAAGTGPAELKAPRARKLASSSAAAWRQPAGAAAAPSGAQATAPISDPAVWYVRLPDGRQSGPLRQSELERQVVAGQVDRRCQLWQEGWPAARWAAEVLPALAIPIAPSPMPHAPTPAMGYGAAAHDAAPPGAGFPPMLGALPPMPALAHPYASPATPPPKRERRRSATLEMTPWVWGGIAVATVVLLMAGLSLVLPPLGIASFFLLLLAGAATSLVGNVWGIVVAFQESTEQGLLYLFVPFYSVYYWITRWDEASRPFWVVLLGFGLCVAAVGMLLLAGLGAALWTGAASAVQ
jgi:hypothetical protein